MKNNIENIVGQLLDIIIFYHKMKKTVLKRNLIIPTQFYDAQFLPIFFQKMVSINAPAVQIGPVSNIYIFLEFE